MAETQLAQIQVRRDTAANWTSEDPTLASGEWGLETDTDKIKIGDGSTSWSSLDYRYEQLETLMQTASAWVNFNGTGTPSITDSFNVSSITDNATGNYTLNFTNALNDANYAVVFGTIAAGTSNVVRNACTYSGGIKSTTQLQIAVGTTNTASLTDLDGIFVAIFGGK